MLSFDESAARLPSPRADEPANVRREIIDELSDHLTCARRREQLAGGSQTEEAVQHRVLDRFGDPAAVARKLWLDWMWEKIMTQRILTGVCILLAVVTCTALAFAWVSIKGQQDLIADLQRTSQSQIEQQQNQMLAQQKQFERLLATAQNSKAPSDWNPVELRFVKGKKDGPPAEGINVTMSIGAEGTGIPPMEATSNKEGVVRFERVRYGSYELAFRNSAKERFSFSIAIQPGESRTETIVCPETPTEPSRVTARIVWPEDLAKRLLWFHFDPESVHRPVAGGRWRSTSIMVNEDGSYFGSNSDLLFAPNADISRVSDNVFGMIRSRPQAKAWERHTVTYQSGRRGMESGRDLFPQMPQGMRWPGSDYRIDNVQVLLPEDPLNSLEELNNRPTEPEKPVNRRGRSPSAQFWRRYLWGISLDSTKWSYRVEPGTAEKPGTLWLTPTAEEIDKLRAALAEIDQAREAAEKAQAELEKARAEREKQQPPAAVPDGENKEREDDK